jgi:hypothetical protein
MPSIKLTAYTQSATSALTTELNSLANAANSAASSLIDNTTNRDQFMDLELVLGVAGSARSAGGSVEVFMVVRLDGTNTSDVNEVSAQRIAVFPTQASTAAQRIVRGNNPLQRIRISPVHFALFARNSTGQALNASGNTLKYRTYTLEV